MNKTDKPKAERWCWTHTTQMATKSLAMILGGPNGHHTMQFLVHFCHSEFSAWLTLLTDGGPLETLSVDS